MGSPTFFKHTFVISTKINDSHFQALNGIELENMMMRSDSDPNYLKAITQPISSKHFPHKITDCNYFFIFTSDLSHFISLKILTTTDFFSLGVGNPRSLTTRSYFRYYNIIKAANCFKPLAVFVI